MSAGLGLLGFDAEDRDAWVVLADALSARGDPRGELLALARRAEQTPADLELRATLRRMRAEQLPRYRAQLREPCVGRWREGLLHTLTLEVPPGLDPDALAQACARTLASEAAVALSRLSLEALEPARALELLLAGRPTPSLYGLALGDGRHRLPQLGALWPRLPGLRELRLRGPGVELGQLRPLGPRLRRLSLALELDPTPLAGFEELELGVLEELELQLGGDGLYDEDAAAALAPVLGGVGLPRLERLRVAGVGLDAAALVALIRSPRLAAVRALELHDDLLGPGALAAIADPALIPASSLRLRLRGCELPGAELVALRAGWGDRLELSACWQT